MAAHEHVDCFGMHTRGCEFTAMSPAAKCGKHGRTVKAR